MDVRKLLRAASPWVPSSAAVSRQQYRRQLRTHWIDQIAQTLAPTSAPTTATASTAAPARGSFNPPASLCFKCRVRTAGSLLSGGAFKPTQQPRATYISGIFSSSNVRGTFSPTSQFYSTRPVAPSKAATYATRHPVRQKLIPRDQTPSSPTRSGFYVRSTAQKGYRHRRSQALLHARYRRAMMMQTYSAPNAVPPLPRLRHRRSAAHRKERRRRGDPDFDQLRPPMLETSVTPTLTGISARQDSLLARQPYYHLKYRIHRRFPKRVRLLGFQHFLSRQTQYSRLFKLNVQRRIMHAQLHQQYLAKRRKFSIRRRFVRSRLSWLDRLNHTLAQEDPRAITITRSLMMSKQYGARQPSGAQFYKLAKLDGELYFRWTRSTMHSKQPQPRNAEEMLTTIDYNHMLRESLNANDTKNALYITRHLIRRYKSPHFQLLDDNHAPPNTGVIFNMMRSLMAQDHYQEALQLFQLVHQLQIASSSSDSSTPPRLDLKLYNSFLGELGAHKHIDEMYAVLQFLEKHGPQPTMHTYNVVLESVANHGTNTQWQAALDLLHQRSQSMTFDQETYLVLALQAVRQHRITEAINWLTTMEGSRKGYTLTATMFDPLIRECIHRAISDLPKMDRKGPLNASRAAVADRQYPWIHASIQLLHMMTDRGLVPTVRTFDLLIEGFLRHRRLPEAQQVLHAMVTTFAQPPSERILTHFFEYYLGQRDYPAAIAMLERIKSLAPFNQPDNASSGGGQKLPRRRLYRYLVRTLLEERQWTLAERTVYDMTFTAGVILSTEELAQLVSKMTATPDAIERILAVVGPVTASSPPETKPGFLREARMALMKAKSEAKVQLERDEVWPMWLAAFKSVSDKRDFALAVSSSNHGSGKQQQRHQGAPPSSSPSSPSPLPLRALTSIEDEERLVQAFALFARASRQPPPSPSPPPRQPLNRSLQKPPSKGQQGATTSSSSSSWSSAAWGEPLMGNTPSGWDFSAQKSSSGGTSKTSAPASSASQGLDETSSQSSVGSSSATSSSAGQSVSSPSLQQGANVAAVAAAAAAVAARFKQEQEAYLEGFIRSTRATLWNLLPSVQARVRTAASEILQRRRERIDAVTEEVQEAAAAAAAAAAVSQKRLSGATKEQKEEEEKKKKGDEREANLQQWSKDPLARIRLARLQAAYARVEALQVDLPHWAAQVYLESLESHGQANVAAALRAKKKWSGSSSSSTQ